MFHTKEGGILCMSFLYACVEVVELLTSLLPIKALSYVCQSVASPHYTCIELTKKVYFSELL